LESNYRSKEKYCRDNSIEKMTELKNFKKREERTIEPGPSKIDYPDYGIKF
jgi:hypothetical protein